MKKPKGSRKRKLTAFDRRLCFLQIRVENEMRQAFTDGFGEGWRMGRKSMLEDMQHFQGK